MMKGIKNFLKSTKGKIVLVIILLGMGFFMRVQLENLYEVKQEKETSVKNYEDGTRVGRELEFAENVSEDNLLLQGFYKQFPTAKMLVACEEDLTDDGLKDLVVIYNTPEKDEHSPNTQLVDGGYIRMVVVMDTGDGISYKFTKPIPAPVENQRVRFQNIDKKEETEFVLQGQKGANVGYGIYRVIDDAAVNLFGEGMEDC